MPKRETIEKHEYGGKTYKPGEEVEVLPEHCLLLSVLGKIKPVEGEPGFGQAPTQTAPSDATRRSARRRANA